MKFTIALLACAVAVFAGDDPAALAAKGLREIRDHHEKAGEKDLYRAIQTWQAEPGGPPVAFAAPATVMATVLEGKRKFAEEQKILDQVDQIYGSAHPPDGPDLALFLELKSAALRRSGDANAAEAAKTRATAIRDRMVRTLFPAAGPAAPQPVEMDRADHRPVLVYKMDPDYSEIGKLARIEGRSVLSVIIEPNGFPSTIHVVHSLGFGLDENAARAVNRWRFEPGLKGGTPVRVFATIEVNFKLL